LTEQLGTFLQLFHTAEGTVSVPNSDADMKAFFNNLKIEQKDDRAVLTAAIPPGFIRKAIASPEPAPPASKSK
jgi:hypothetical protein